MMVEKWVTEGDDWSVARRMAQSSRDGQVNLYHPVFLQAIVCASLTLAAVGSATDAGTSYLDALPPEDDRRVTDSITNEVWSFASARVVLAEVFEQTGRHEDAVRWATAECSDSLSDNGPSRIRAGAVLGRAHAARGEHSLSIAAFDAALALAQTGRYLLSALLVVRARALVGREVAGREGEGCGHWSEQTGRQRLSEVVSRMEVGGAEAEKLELEAALLQQCE